MNILITASIYILAILLRLNYDIFIPGYCFDEIAIVGIAKESFPLGIIKTLINTDYHAPLYYFIVHFFTHFSNEWVYLRIFNVILSTINIFVFYKIARLLLNKKLSYILPLLFTLWHLQITTVSFVKYYCFCILLFSINLYYFIKIIKKDAGYYKFAFCSMFFILSSTLGFIAVFVQYLILIYSGKRTKKLFYSFLISFLGFLLYFPILIKQFLMSINTPISPHSGFSGFSFIALYNFFNDYFSPLVNYSCNLITIESYSYYLNIINSFYNKSFDLFSFFVFLFFSFIPTFSAIFLVFYSIKKNKTILLINVFSFSYLLIFIILNKLKITGFIPLYLYPCGIALIIVFAAALSYINKTLRHVILFYLITINLLISTYYPINKRGETKAKIYYGVEKYFKEHNQKNTYYILSCGGRFLKSYYKNKNTFDFDWEKMGGGFQKEYLGYIFGKNKVKNINSNNISKIIIPLILEDKKSPDFEEYFNENIKNKLKKGDKIVLMFDASEESFLIKKRQYLNDLKHKKYSRDFAKLTIRPANDEDVFNGGYLQEIILTYSFEYLIELLDKNFKRILVEQYTKTTDNDYIRTFESKNFQKSTLWIGQNALKGWIFVTYQKQ